jgi:hypothetical protein
MKFPEQADTQRPIAVLWFPEAMGRGEQGVTVSGEKDLLFR